MLQYTIKSHTSVRDALKVLNELSSHGLTLFVIDEKERVIGALTDGDIRRFFINGGNLDDDVDNAMMESFSYLSENDTDKIAKFKEYKVHGVKVVPILDSKMRLLDVIDTSHQNSCLPIDAVLMAGGKGERLRPLTGTKPKPLLPVGDKCIIDHNVDRLISYGISHVNVTVNYLHEQIEEHFRQPRSGVKVRTFREPEFFGTIGSIRLIDTFYNDTILVMNSDLFTNIDFEDFYLHFCQHNAEMSVAAIPYDVSIPLGILDLQGSNIRGLIEKPKYNYYANAGIYLIKKSALDEIPDDTFFNATDLIERLIIKGKKVIRFPLNGTWIDIGNPQEYQKAKELVNHIK